VEIKVKIITLVGIPGSGKSSILKEIVQKCPSVLIVNYGDQMLKVANAEGLTRDMLRKLPISSQQEIGIKAAKQIIREKNEITIIDTHALIKTEVGFCPGLPKEVLKVLSPKALVWIDCPTSLILERRKGDTSRTRDLETEEELTIHHELTHSYLAACCMETGALLCRIVNRDPSIEKNCQPLIRLIEQLGAQ
jgi:adenylate kinase